MCIRDRAPGVHAVTGQAIDGGGAEGVREKLFTQLFGEGEGAVLRCHADIDGGAEGAVKILRTGGAQRHGHHGGDAGLAANCLLYTSRCV